MDHAASEKSSVRRGRDLLNGLNCASGSLRPASEAGAMSISDFWG